MNWEAVGALSEVIGAVAVIASLIYLAIQVRSSSRATRATVHLALYDSDAQFYSLLLSDSALRNLFDQVVAGDPELSSADPAYLSHLLNMRFNKYELFFFLAREGMFTRDVEHAMIRIIAQRLESPAIKAWWDDSHDNFSADFVDWVNERASP